MRTFFLTVAVSLALGLAASASVAQDNEPSEADIEQAKTAFGEGRSLYDAGDKRGAVAKFKQSYRLSRNALLLYNIGLTYDELGEVDLAIFYYDKFLTDTDRKVANRGLAQKRLTELRKEAERKRAAEAERAASAPKDAEPEAEPEPAQSVERPDEGMEPEVVKKAGGGGGLSFGSGVAEKDVVIFTRQLATMIDAGLPLVQCLDILSSQTENKNFARILSNVKGTVEQGATFSDALRKHPKVFDQLYVNLIAAGEVGGILDTILHRLATYIEKAVKLKRQVKGAMTYPIAVLGVALIVVSVLLTKVIPVFENMEPLVRVWSCALE